MCPVVFIGKGGYWEGRAGGRQGWFPAKAIKDVEDGDSGVFVEPGESLWLGFSVHYTLSFFLFHLSELLSDSSLYYLVHPTICFPHIYYSSNHLFVTFCQYTVLMKLMLHDKYYLTLDNSHTDR